MVEQNQSIHILLTIAAICKLTLDPCNLQSCLEILLKAMEICYNCPLAQLQIYGRRCFTQNCTLTQNLTVNPGGLKAHTDRACIQPCVGKQRIAFNPSNHQRSNYVIQPESASSPVILDKQDQGIILGGGKNSYVP